MGWLWRVEGLWDGFGGGWEGTRAGAGPINPQLTLFSSKTLKTNVANFGGVPKWEELLVDLLEACCVQLPTGAVLDEALVPGGRGQRRGDGEGDSDSITTCWELLPSAPEAGGLF